MRERALCCWVNTVCARKKIPVASIGTELDNGIILITIVELGFKHRVTARYVSLLFFSQEDLCVLHTAILVS